MEVFYAQNIGSIVVLWYCRVRPELASRVA